MTTARIYISGPISELTHEQASARFALAETLLRNLGYTRIVNPMSIWPLRFPWLHRLMQNILGVQLTHTLIFFYSLFLLATRCQRIYKIPGWKKSRGAQMESCVAYHFNLFLIDNRDRADIDKSIENEIQKQEGMAL